MKKVLIPSLETNDTTALSLGPAVLTAMNGNLNFPTPPVPMADLQVASANYATSHAKAKYGSREDKSQKNADKAALLQLLRSLAIWINAVATSETALASTGFPLSKTREPRVLGTAQPTADYGANSGELVLSTPAVEGSVSYNHQITANVQTGPWQDNPSSKAKCKIANLTPGVVYGMRIVTIGTSGQMTVSETITKMAV